MAAFTKFRKAALTALISGFYLFTGAQEKPNIIFIYADDLGYGDVSCYGAEKIRTPHIDHLASRGIRFTNAHASSATCTPSRYSLLTGEYAWRKEGTGIAPGNASLILDTSHATIASVLKKAGYTTGVVGKWHLGLGGPEGPDWNGVIKPGPLEVGFDYSYIMAATLDRVPTVFIEGHHIVSLDHRDPVKVNYQHKIGSEPTGKENPELLKMKPSNGHSNTIVNGISRIGWMSGGKAAWWKDEYIADQFTEKAQQFIVKNQKQPFFLYFASGDPHVPRDPHPRFVGKSGMGPRGDAILQFDWSVGQVLKTIDSLGLNKNTLIILTSDNGPVVDDGYHDQAAELLNGHTPWGPFRGGKYSIFEAGTRMPFIVSWPGSVKQGTVTNALISQVDMAATFAALTGQRLQKGEAPDSFNMLDALLGKSTKGRQHLVEHAGTLALLEGPWKYIEPSHGPAVDTFVNIELGNSPKPQLYNLEKDRNEQHNLAEKYPKKVKKMAALLEEIKKDSEGLRKAR